MLIYFCKKIHLYIYVYIIGAKLWLCFFLYRAETLILLNLLIATFRKIHPVGIEA